MELAADLRADLLSEGMPERPIRSYPALLSTHADALAWARGGAPEGAVVVADYQAAPRGRAGIEWAVRAGADLSFSLVLRPRLPAEREGWLYTVAASGLADAVGRGATIEWPDTVRKDGDRAGAVAVHAELGPGGCEWAVVSVLVTDARPPRAPLLREVTEAIESRYRSPSAAVLADYLRRSETLGRHVCARLIPLGPAGPRVTGKAVSSLTDGALVLETAKGNRVAVRPQNLGVLEDAA